ncbi:hypothetical protein BT63DRAFT_56418 [Microthyrium microscopicum]|uniref:Chitin-binding type-1 domain-containing protein n=1 Tax=Microthyrium microscopicum TaxID=703497 RepID=A0A6A6U336_9PEZI|nr:hypothetical protein BT63DRAFT_56418 [Microthyrium microscopicum]
MRWHLLPTLLCFLLATITPLGYAQNETEGIECGIHNGGAKCGPNEGCCSHYGWCGFTNAHCLDTNRCQRGYGECSNGTVTSTSPSPATATSQPAKNGPLSDKAIIAIATVGGSIVIACLVVLVCCCMQRNNHRHQRQMANDFLGRPAPLQIGQGPVQRLIGGRPGRVYGVDD